MLTEDVVLGELNGIQDKQKHMFDQSYQLEMVLAPDREKVLEKLRDLKPGESFSFPFPENYDQGTAAAYLSKLFNLLREEIDIGNRPSRKHTQPKEYILDRHPLFGSNELIIERTRYQDNSE